MHESAELVECIETAVEIPTSWIRAHSRERITRRRCAAFRLAEHRARAMARDRGLEVLPEVTRTLTSGWFSDAEAAHVLIRARKPSDA